MTSIIDAVIFDWRIAVDHNTFFESFYASDGWKIVEPEPGRIVLEREGATTIVQSVPYVLRVHVAEAPALTAAGSATPSLASQAGLLSSNDALQQASQRQADALREANPSPSKHAKRKP